MVEPLVSVCTLIYNTNPRYVIEAIESVRANQYSNIQHIIIDDCSPDVNSKQEVKKWIQENNYPCEFYEHEVNYGLNKTLNHVLSVAKGKYLFACGDDLMMPNTFKVAVDLLESLPAHYAGVFSDVYLIDGANNPLPDKRTYLKRSYPQYVFPSKKEVYYENLLNAKANFIAPMSAAIKLDVLKELNGYDENLNFEDYDMFLRILKKYDLKYSDTILAKYRIHDESFCRASRIDWEWNYFNIFLKHHEHEIAISQIKKILDNVIKTQWNIYDYIKKIKKINSFSTRAKLYFFILETEIKYSTVNRIKHRLKLIFSKS
jgi:glycosyltransferase involved in cell wall biosynthesis